MQSVKSPDQKISFICLFLNNLDEFQSQQNKILARNTIGGSKTHRLVHKK